MKDFGRVPRYLHGDDKLLKFWQDYFDNHQWEEGEQFGIYIDFPFCRSICKYCAFSSYRFSDYTELIPIYEEAVISLLTKLQPVLLPKIANNIYFGGGTPTLWTNDSLKRIVNLIPEYDKILIRKVEAHPHDLTPEKVAFLIKEMRLNSISIGVQSFDKAANLSQQRIPVKIEQLTEAVREFQKHNVFVNIDLVSLFNGEKEEDWKLFQNDLEIGASVIKPDSFCVNPNFRVDDYYGHSVQHRIILKEFSEKNPYYSLHDKRCYSTKREDIEFFMDGTYMLMSPNYRIFLEEGNPALLNRQSRYASKSNVIGFGGNRLHPVISRTSNMDQINSHFDFERKRWVHMLRPIAIVDATLDHSPPPIQIGHCVIKPHNETEE